MADKAEFVVCDQTISTWLRARYAARSNPGRRRSPVLVGITAPMRRERRCSREGRPAKALSPTTRRGRRRGRPPRLRRTAPASSSVGRARLSWRSPPVRWKVTGLPQPSARTWILVEKPPRERPSASPPDSAGPASAGGVLMSAHYARIHKVQVPVEQARRISLGLHRLQEALPDPCLAPTVKPARHGPDRAVALGQVTPGRARAQDPQNPVQEGAVVVVWATRPGSLRGQKRLQTPPLRIRQLVTLHAR
jgi:hypothetical protein